MNQLIVFDCDGVIFRGNEVLPYVPETFALLRKRNIPYRFITNNSSRTRRYLADKIRGMGVPLELENMHATAYATRLYLDKHARPGARVYIVGEDGLHSELKGYKIVSAAQSHTAEYVVVGYDRRFTFKKLAAAVAAVFAGAVLIATNRDATYPVEGGVLLPGGGTMVAAIETAAGPASVVIGKPEPLMLLQLLEEAGVKARDALLIGDRAETDILAGRLAGMKTCLALTGVTTPEAVPGLPAAARPDYVARDMRGVAALLGLSRGRPAAPWKEFKPQTK
jgi:4-nitrophenyl phosphatase